MTAPRHPILAGVFVAWFGLTVAGQKLYRREGAKTWWDGLHLIIPDWRFFAPDPGVYDHHVLVRGVRADGSSAGWHEITDVGERRVRHAFWHPRQRIDKATFDVCAELLRFIETRRRLGVDTDEIRRAVQLSIPYLTLVTLASSEPLDDESAGVQFMVVISGGYDDEPPETVFLSECHPRDARPSLSSRQPAG